jgi:hypothetical protein
VRRDRNNRMPMGSRDSVRRVIDRGRRRRGTARARARQKMPVLVRRSGADNHAPYDHCTVKFLRQAGVKLDWIRLAELGIHGNSHVMMLEKNNKEIAAVIAQWLDKAVPERE